MRPGRLLRQPDAPLNIAEAHPERMGSNLWIHLGGREQGGSLLQGFLALHDNL
jgi:hypothetical protein